MNERMDYDLVADAELVADAMFENRHDYSVVQAAIWRLGLDGPIFNLAGLKSVLRAAEQHARYPFQADGDRPYREPRRSRSTEEPT